MSIHKRESLIFVALLSNRDRNLTGGSVFAASAAAYILEKMDLVSSDSLRLAGFDGGPTTRK